MSEPATKVEHFLTWCKNHRWLSYVLIVGIVLGAVAGVVTSTKTLVSALVPNVAQETVNLRKEVDVPGIWRPKTGDQNMSSGSDLRLSVDSSLRLDGSTVWLDLVMRCSETKPDYTEVQGYASLKVYEAPEDREITSFEVVGNKGVGLSVLSYATHLGNRAYFETTGTFWERLYFELPEGEILDWNDVEQIKLHGTLAATIKLVET